MGYGPAQMVDLEATINHSPADVVLVATPVDLVSLLKLERECVRLTYEIQPLGKPNMEDILVEFLEQYKLAAV
jgi:predicted GTPase